MESAFDINIKTINNKLNNYEICNFINYLLFSTWFGFFLMNPTTGLSSSVNFRVENEAKEEPTTRDYSRFKGFIRELTPTWSGFGL